MKYLLVYLVTVPIFLAIDLFWIGVVANNYYFQNIPGLAERPNWIVALIFYLIYIIGIIFFAVWPNLGREWHYALFYGALFGFFAYATYDLTNYSVMKDWPLTISVIDIAWGTFLTATVSAIAHLIANRFII